MLWHVGRITSLFARKVVGVTHPTLDRAALLASVGIDATAPADPAHMLDAAEYYALLERIARAEPDGVDLPLRAGASMRSDDYGAFGLAWKSAPNLRGSFERAERYARVLTNVATYRVEDAPEGTYMHLQRAGDRALGMRLSNEATLASILSISREVSTGSFQPRAVYLRHPAPAGAKAHERHFGCPIHFGTDRDALLTDPASLVVPNRLGDTTIAAFFDSHLESALADLADDHDPLPADVRRHVTNALSGGVPRVSAIATALGLSPRTLQRRLAERELSFQTLVDEARRQLAERLLRDSAFPLAEVAFLTGFSEQSAFNRAFRRWSGQTPRSYRLAATD